MTRSALMARVGMAAALVVVLVVGLIIVMNDFSRTVGKNQFTAFFANSNGIFAGDDVRILGVPVGRIDTIEPSPDGAKITFWVDDTYDVPADAKAVILSPSLVTARAIQLTPVYTSGPVLPSDSVISVERTAVPVEFDDFRQQLEKLSDSLQPTQPGGVSTLGAFVNTTADNLRGEGANIRDTLVELSAAFSALGDHSTDLFGTLKNLSILVSALRSSTDLTRQLNVNLAAVTGLLSNGPNEVGQAVADLSSFVREVRAFVADNRESVGTTSDKLASVTTALTQSADDIEEVLHIAPNTFQNFANIYQPAQATFSGALAAANFTNPIGFLCGAIQAASRLGAEQASKLCVQYLAPIIKNRQINFPPLGENLFVGSSARPNELTYSEDWLRPDYVPPAPTEPVAPAPPSPPLAAEAQATNPADGLPGLMVPVDTEGTR